MGCGAETEANALHTTLTKDEVFVIPTFDLSSADFNLPAPGPLNAPVRRLTNDDLTTGTIDGTGTFDVMMRSMNSHLEVEFKKNRLVGSEYSKAYIALTDAAMEKSIQFLLGQEQAYWAAMVAQQQALLTQIQIVTARVQLQIAKVQLASLQLEAAMHRANYALLKMKLSTESVQYCIAQYTLANMLPAQRSQILAQTTMTEAQTVMTETQTANLRIEGQIQTFNLEEMLPQQLLLLVEQTHTQHAQTSDTFGGGGDIEGTLGAQRRLYDQQITSYQRDAELKATKVFTDAWITQKTLDEDLPPPVQFSNASLEQLLVNIKLKNVIGTETIAPPPAPAPAPAPNP